MTEVITIATLLWDASKATFTFSHSYDESWVEKLYYGCVRNLTQPFRFVCFTEKPRKFSTSAIETVWIEQGDPIGYEACIEPYRMDVPMILMGLDTIIVGNIDHLAQHCLTATRIAVPMDPGYPDTVCNGVALVPGGMRARMFDAHRGENDMEWIREHWRSGEIDVLDTLFPGQVQSFKGSVFKRGLGDDARICYFHGFPKPSELAHVGWIYRHWHTVVPDAEVAA